MSWRSASNSLTLFPIRGRALDLLRLARSEREWRLPCGGFVRALVTLDKQFSAQSRVVLPASETQCDQDFNVFQLNKYAFLTKNLHHDSNVFRSTLYVVFRTGVDDSPVQHSRRRGEKQDECFLQTRTGSSTVSSRLAPPSGRCRRHGSYR